MTGNKQATRLCTDIVVSGLCRNSIAVDYWLCTPQKIDHPTTRCHDEVNSSAGRGCCLRRWVQFSLALSLWFTVENCASFVVLSYHLQSVDCISLSFFPRSVHLPNQYLINREGKNGLVCRLYSRMPMRRVGLVSPARLRQNTPYLPHDVGFGFL